MGREIKFRGKVLGSEEWVYGNYQKGKGKHPHAISWWTIQQHEDDIWDEIEFAEVDPETVGQYTGLKDRNGKEIYEGDIIENYFSKRDDFCYEVIWYQETGQWMFDPFMKGDSDAPLLGIEEFLQDWDTVGFDDGTVEVIGNIYSNPELLGGTGA